MSKSCGNAKIILKHKEVCFYKSRLKGDGEVMRRIVLDMQCNMFADAISQALNKNDPDFVIRRTESPDQTVAVCKFCLAYALVMEVTKYSPWLLEERLKLCKEVKKHVPECKILFLVDENADAELANAVKQVKKDGLIDNFIYASVSPTYLAAILDTL